uniref:Uncharacterized protein n=1 Tax=Anguilla anguilla TaxID=7936 RepID=A0A0E9PJQ5_ANGAN
MVTHSHLECIIHNVILILSVIPSCF